MGLMKLSFLLLLIYTFDEFLAEICDNGRGCPDGYICDKCDGMHCYCCLESNCTLESSWSFASSSCNGSHSCLKNQFCYRDGCLYKEVMLCDLYLNAENELNCTGWGNNYLLKYAYPICKSMHSNDWKYLKSHNWRYWEDYDNQDISSRVRNVVICITSTIQQRLSELLDNHTKNCSFIERKLYQHEIWSYAFCDVCIRPESWLHLFKIINNSINIHDDPRRVITTLIQACVSRYADYEGDEFYDSSRRIASRFRKKLEDLSKDLIPMFDFDLFYSKTLEEAETHYSKNSICSFLKAFFHKNFGTGVTCEDAYSYVSRYFILILIGCPLLAGLFLHLSKGLMNLFKDSVPSFLRYCWKKIPPFFRRFRVLCSEEEKIEGGKKAERIKKKEKELEKLEEELEKLEEETKKKKEAQEEAEKIKKKKEEIKKLEENIEELKKAERIEKLKEELKELEEETKKKKEKIEKRKEAQEEAEKIEKKKEEIKKLEEEIKKKKEELEKLKT